LEDNGVIFSDNISMMNHAKEFYKNLFGFEPRGNIKFDGGFGEENEKVSSEENEMLEYEFSETEIKKLLRCLMLKGLLALIAFSSFSIKDYGLSLKMILWPW
jgi:hypothetical protein